MKDIEIRLKELRKDRSLSQEELANQLGISRQSVISLERGEYLPSLPLMIDLINFFEIPFGDLICCEGIENINENEKGGEHTMAREITPWSPIREVSSLHDAIDRMFDDVLATPRMAFVPPMAVPMINIRDTEKAVIVEAELPGVKEDDIDLEITDDALTIKGEKKSEQETKEKDYFRREFSYGSFVRTIALPTAVESDKAEAEMKNGVLTITLPKEQQALPKKKKIQIKK